MNAKKRRAKSTATETHLVRDAEAWDNVELFLVSAVISILSIRFYLELTGYPKVGGGGLHIAHVLWGGLLMLVAVMLLLIWWNPSMRRFGAFLAGLGFGTFIDEIGKFITHDNDYFFEPAAMIMYTIFILLFLSARVLIGNRPMSEGEERANRSVRELIPAPASTLGSKVGFYFTAKDRVVGIYRKIVLNRWFKIVLTAGFIVIGVSGLATVAGTIARRPDLDPGVSFAQMAASTASLACIWAGIWFLGRSRLRAYIWFKRSVLINMYITQIFVFYYHQFAALGGLAQYLLLYFALHFVIARESEAGVD
ncbi:MAG TPA: hypothetical protein ENO08_03295 [Candidatus Eisenbacteria bacterium]|uniref:Uncharacterized protein n=1 Tax=Eiseniibacteriota bacterium TaxID=2212470 RepID=A0A7V2AUF6_UNCEI|nr:hypothetical protein [Candidatus Eisenbacteria bacterium]